MDKQNCPFCNCAVDKSAVILYENKNIIVRLDLFPITPRHLIVFPKGHIEDLTDLSSEVWLDLLDGIKNAKRLTQTSDFKALYTHIINTPFSEKSTAFIKAALESPFINKIPDAYNIGNNEGEAAGRSIDHCHIHIVPRYWGDVKNPRGGIRGIFGNGNY